MNNSSTILKCKNLNKRFNGVTAVKNVNLELQSGCITGLMGENGCGKTTLLNIISRLVEIDTGNIEYFGINHNSIKPSNLMQLGIARSFQLIRNFSNMSLIDNMLLSFNSEFNHGLLAPFIKRPSNRRIENQLWKEAFELFDYFGLTTFKARETYNRPVRDFSIGEQRIIEIIRIILSKPKLLLLDEPSVGLNKIINKKLSEYFKKLALRGCSILIISHDNEFLSDNIDELMYMKDGEISNEGIEQSVVKTS